jgi:hypothetical protein
MPSLGVFTGTEEQGAVLYVAAAARGPLGEAFETFRAGLPDGIRVVDRIYSPALWIPHITLALGLDPAMLDRALSIATRRFRPIASDAEDLELYELWGPVTADSTRKPANGVNASDMNHTADPVRFF